MSKYLVEVTHGADRLSCLHAIQVFQSTGNHFLVNADWGCGDGVHKAWFMLDVESKEEALRIVPPASRKDATVILLEKFNMKQVEEMLAEHTPGETHH
ncbi:MAG TPA: hypothetical protein VHO50_00745 [Bacteroidales bacterium]|nr:hypothetical protein [Bacteroidales bacterium]